MKFSLFSIVAMSMIATSAPAQSPADQAALRQAAVAFSDSWNRRDHSGLVANMTEDVVFVTAGARRLQGKAAVERYHRGHFRRSARDSTNATTNVFVRFLRPDLAIVERQWRLEGHRYPDGRPRLPQVGLMTMVSERKSGRWAFTSIQNSSVAGTVPPCQCTASPRQ